VLPQILIVNDDKELSALVATTLQKEGFRTLQADSGFAAIEAFHAHQPVLVILGARQVDMDGLELCRRLKAFKQVLILFLTSHTEEIDQLSGFAAGADEYMVKPFFPRVLAARVKSMLRRHLDSIQPDSVLIVGPIVLDQDCRTVHARGTEVHLTRIEFDLLAVLMEKPKRVFSREELMMRVWDGWHCGGHVLESHLSRLRSKFRDVGEPTLAVAVRGFGYKLGIEIQSEVNALVRAS